MTKHKKVQERKTTEVPTLNPDEISKWATVKSSKMAHALSYSFIETESLQSVQGLDAVYVLHTDSGTVVQTMPKALQDRAIERDPFTSIRRLASLSDFRSVSLSYEDTLYVAGPILSQPNFIYVVALKAELANYALAKARFTRVFT